MAILGAGRANDSTLVSSVDDVIQELELDLCQILGIEPGQPVNASIFGLGLASSDGYPIQVDGSIRSVLNLSLGAVATSPNASCGFEFRDTNEAYRIVLVNSELRVYHEVGGAWVHVSTLNNPVERLVDLSDVDMPTLDDTVDGFRVVIDTVTVPGEHSFKLVSPAVGEEFNILDGEDVVDPLPGYLNQHLTLFEEDPPGSGKYFVGYDPAGGGGGGPYYVGELVDAPTVPVPPNAVDAGAVLMQGYGAGADTFSQQRVLAGAGGGVTLEPAVGDSTWYQILFDETTFSAGGGPGAHWRSNEFFTDGSLNITMPEAGFYFVKYVVDWPQNVFGNRRGVRLVVESGGGNLGAGHFFSPKFRVQDGGNDPSGYIRSIAGGQETVDFIRVDQDTVLRLEVNWDIGEDYSGVIAASVGFVKIR